MKRKLLVPVGLLALLIGAFAAANCGDAVFARSPQGSAQKGASRMIDGVRYDPPSPEQAPASIRAAVMLGYNIMNNPQKYAGRYVGDSVSCSNCHFNGGITAGGKNGGLSLVGVTTKYPAYRSRAKAVVDMIFRTNSCFERSMNGKALPANSKQMVALITYFQWISRGLPVYERIPWLGLKHIESRHKPNAAAGKKIFTQTCSACHGMGGQGTKIAPPLWGKYSFNDGAGMSHLQNFAAFVYKNMPYGVANLTPDQALDVAAYVTSRPRPHFNGK